MIGRKFFLMMASQGLTAILSFVGLFFMTRYLSAGTYGTIALAISFTATFNAVADFGFNIAHIKRVSEGKDLEECLSTFVTLKILLIIAMVILSIIFIPVYGYLSHQTITGEGQQIILLFILFYVFYNVAAIATATFDARLKTAKTQISLLADPLIRTPLIILVCLGSRSALDIALCYVIGGLAVAIIALVLLSRERVHWKRPVLIRSYAAFALPYSATIIFAALIMNIDRLVIGAYWGEADVGYFTAALAIVTLLSIIGSSVATLVFPTFSHMNSQGLRKEIAALTNTAERYVSLLTLPIIVLVVCFPTAITSLLLGDNFLPAAESLRILALAIYISLINGTHTSQMNAVSRPLLNAKISAIALALNIALLLLLVPPTFLGVTALGLGPLGAAWAKLITFLALVVITRSVLRSLTGIRSSYRILIHFAAGGLTALALLVLGQYWAITQWYDLIIFLSVSYGLFAGLMFLTGELGIGDLRFFLNVIDPKEMGSYLRGELRAKEKQK
jgi:O-antigen/teichoic acid export membrane protein